RPPPPCARRRAMARGARRVAVAPRAPPRPAPAPPSGAAPRAPVSAEARWRPTCATQARGWLVGGLAAAAAGAAGAGAIRRRRRPSSRGGRAPRLGAPPSRASWAPRIRASPNVCLRSRMALGGS
ncbi:unnamed protein product, partial [Prorocentrum cordatum]